VSSRKQPHSEGELTRFAGVRPPRDWHRGQKGRNFALFMKAKQATRGTTRKETRRLLGEGPGVAATLSNPSTVILLVGPEDISTGRR